MAMMIQMRPIVRMETNESNDKDELRQELLHEFSEVKDSDAEEIEQLFGDVIDEVETKKTSESSRGIRRTRTGLCCSSRITRLLKSQKTVTMVRSLCQRRKAHMVSRVLRKYKHRWGLRTDLSKSKSFRVRTTSMNPEYRFFNFLYACTLYNVWRLTDLLVKLELLAESEFEYKPLVTADLFLTIAKEYNIVGLDPPD